MREVDTYTRWKFLDKGEHPKFEFFDKNGVSIHLGDHLGYKRRVKTKYQWSEELGRRVFIPGFTKDMIVEVIGFKCFVKRTGYSFRPQVLKYVVVMDENRNQFRLYNTQKNVYNLSSEIKKIANDVSKTLEIIEPMIFSNSKTNDDVFELGLN